MDRIQQTTETHRGEYVHIRNRQWQQQARTSAPLSRLCLPYVASGGRLKRLTGPFIFNLLELLDGGMKRPDALRQIIHMGLNRGYPIIFIARYAGRGNVNQVLSWNRLDRPLSVTRSRNWPGATGIADGMICPLNAFSITSGELLSVSNCAAGVWMLCR